MAFNVSFVLKAIDKFSTPVRKINDRLDKLNNKMRKTGQESEKATRKMGGMAGVLSKIPGPLKAMVAGFAGLQGLSKVTQIVGDFEDALLELSAITGATGKDLKFLEKAAFDLGGKYGEAGKDILRGMKLVASAKPELLENTAALKDVTEQVLLLTKASGLDMETASKTVARALNIFGEGSEKAAEFVNILAAESKFGASEIESTGLALIKAGPAANALGLELAELTSLIDVLALGGIEAQQAGTGLNSTLIKLSAAGADFRKESLDEVFLKYGRALNKIKDPQQRSLALQKLVGLENIKVAETLFAAAGGMDAYANKIRGTNTAQEQADIRMQGFRQSMKRLNTSFEKITVTIFSKFSPMITQMADSFATFMDEADPDVLEGIAGIFRVIAAAVWLVVEAIKILLSFLGKAMKNFTRIAKLFGLVAAEIGSGGKLEFFKEVKNIFKSSAEVGGKVDINVNDKGGNVSSVSSTPQGDVGLNVGMNMPGAG